MNPRIPAWTRSCVYTITSPDGEQYVGSTTNVWFRWSRHRQRLRLGAHSSKILQAAFDAHGEDSLKFEKVIFCEKKDLLMYEQIVMDFLNPVCNQLKFAGKARGFKWTDEMRAKASVERTGKKRKPFSEEARENMSRTRIGRKLSEEHKEKLRASSTIKRAVQCLETNQIFASAAAAADWLPSQNKRAAAANICRACKGKSNTASGYTWRYA